MPAPIITVLLMMRFPDSEDRRVNIRQGEEPAESELFAGYRGPAEFSCDPRHTCNIKGGFQLTNQEQTAALRLWLSYITNTNGRL